MGNEIWILIVTAATLGFVHTILGPDHYLPFIVMSKARNWTTFRTVMITVLCGLGHVASSVVVGAIGDNIWNRDKQAGRNRICSRRLGGMGISDFWCRLPFMGNLEA